MVPSSNQAIERFLSRADGLQVFPTVAARIQAVVENPNSSLTDLERAVSMDPALSAKVLKVANSPFYGLKRAVGSLRQALLMMGFWATRNLALALVMHSIGRPNRPKRKDLWYHSIRCAVAARKLAQTPVQGDPQEVFVLGLLHDIGKLILLELDEEHYLPILLKADSDETTLVESELDALTYSHADLGAACLERWNLPKDYILTVQCHHDFSSLPPDCLPKVQMNTAIVVLSNLLEYGVSKGKAPEDLGAELISSDAGHYFGLTQPLVDEVVELISKEDGSFDFA